ncbi:hypothetical protein NBRC10513_001388 [Rhodotorula toruloides]|uniref:BY PROTMAP: gi/472581643/gb/EMS19371.1/ zinc finger, PHD-type protein [Rhodosporidium toruloides NP11] n=1 Tax=Rhodotorula toruloides TaxID=5286 RepID=A0A0K3CKU7_RHOTO|nr:hypothetical protein AAT19DRAFT_16858 [Rhodotorula toruloides]
MSTTLSDQEIAAGLRKLRTDFRTAAIAHFSVLFLHHLGGTFNTSDFELDLLSVKPDAQIPALLGKILNTLANDRNTNSTNWLSALRRSYNRRVGREDNPFYSWHRVPGSVVEAERAIERAREEAEYDAYMAAKAGGASGSGEGVPKDVKKEENEQVERSIFADAEDKLRQAEKALYRKAGKKKAGTPFTVGESDDVIAARIKEEDKAAKEDGSLVREAGAADVNVSGKTAEAGVPVTEAALDDGFNAEMADVIAQDAAEGAFQEQQAEAKKEEDADEDEEEWYEEQRAVEWKDLSLETKLDAIYNVCEWHMVDPAQQFRKYLQWDGEAAWRLDPIGTDSEGNKYFHTADDRLWIQRDPPAADPSNPSDQPVRKPRTLLGLRAGPRDKSKKGTVTGVVRFKLKKNAETGAFEQVAEDEEAGPSSGVKGEEGDEDVKMGTSGPASDAVKGEDDEGSNLGSPALSSSKKLADEPVVEQEMPSWEKQYWEERQRAENTPGFVEWEAVCTTLDDWRAFPERFAKSTHPDEIKLRELVALELIPAVEQGIEDEKQRREEERLAEEAKSAELAAQLSKRSSSRVPGVDEDGNPISDRPTRAARQQVRSYADDGLSEFVPAESGTPKAESREDRLRKREEERKRLEEEQERKLMEELREQERQEAMEKNGGVLPYELMNDDERAEYERQQEKERKRLEAEEKKRQKDEAKRARARERRAERKAERDAEAAADAEAEAAVAPPPPAPVLPIPPADDAAVDESWYLDCEICGTAGWNYDDGLGLICCDSCEDWQHLPCHQQADALAGRIIPYEDEAFKWICGHCKGTRQRRPRPPKPAAGSPPQLVYPPHPLEPVTGQKRKASVSNGNKGAAAAQAAAKKPKATKSNGQSIPYGHGGHPLYHPSAYQHPQAVQSPTYSSASPTAPTPAPAPAPAAAQPAQNASMSYEELKAAIEANPSLMAQLPQEYQVHFSQLLGLPLPS